MQGQVRRQLAALKAVVVCKVARGKEPKNIFSATAPSTSEQAEASREAAAAAAAAKVENPYAKNEPKADDKNDDPGPGGSAAPMRLLSPKTSA